MFPNSKNFWGEIPKNVEVRTPFLILKEQASILTQMTNGLLVGEADRKTSIDQNFFVRLRIRVPALNNYTYSLVEVKYPPQLYPLSIIDLTGSGQYAVVCPSEEEFEAALSRILSSDVVKRVISTLLADIQSGDELQENTF